MLDGEVVCLEVVKVESEGDKAIAGSGEGDCCCREAKCGVDIQPRGARRDNGGRTYVLAVTVDGAMVRETVQRRAR